MSARSFATTLKPKATKQLARHKRRGAPTEAEQALVRQFVADQPAEITSAQEKALARTMRRSTEAVRALIEDAKLHLGETAMHYVDVHRRAVDNALANGDPKSLEVAVRGSQWAMENLSVDGVRVIDTAVKGPQGTKILIGVKIGGGNTEVTGAVVDADPPVKSESP